MKNNIFRYLTLGVVLVSLFVSCRKDKFVDDTDETKESGTTYLKFMEGPENKLFFRPFTDIRPVQILDLRRDAHSNASLNTASTVVLTQDDAAIAAYNTAHSENYEVLPTAIYTLSTSSVGYTKTATGYNVSYAAGDVAKPLTINLNGALYDLSKKYALAFKVADAGGATTTATAQKTIIVLISIKNKWDGIYEITEGTMTDVVSPTLSHINNFLGLTAEKMQYELRTISETKCEVYDNYFFGGYYTPITSGASYSNYGTFCVILEFDPATDKVVAVTNRFGQPAAAPNLRGARLDPTGINEWKSGEMKIKYNMTQQGGISPALAAPYVRTTWTETWKFIGDR